MWCADGQVIQLPRLLSLLAASQDGQRLAQLVKILTAERGKVVQPEHVALLIDKRSRPVVIVAPEPRLPVTADGRSVPHYRGNPSISRQA